ncbi:MAG: serine hydrolase domain-containing protein [Croceivirga sp.]
MRNLFQQLIIFLCCISFSAQAQDSLQINSLAASFLKQTKLPGLSLAVAKGGNVIYAKGFGFYNVEDNRPMLPSTRIRTASVAKVLTATALGRLATEGLIDFDTPIKNYIPYINDTYANLTVRQLAGHTSGLKHRPSKGGHQNRQYNTIRETLEIIDAPLLFEPGTDYKYSSAAFNILAAVIEGASGMLYADYMQTQVFEPLNIKQTSPENINELTDMDAAIYLLKNGKLKRDKPTNDSYKIPGASFRSTPSDLVKLMNAYTGQGFISKEVVKDMFTSNRLPNGEMTQVGIAWRSSFDIFGNRVIEHAGSWLGARTVLVYYPDKDLSISLMVNAQCPLLIEETAHIFAQFFINENQDIPKVPLNKEVQVLYNSKKGQKKHLGNIFLDDGQGILSTDIKGYLASNSVIQLKNGFVLCTMYGLFFMEMDANIEGNVYAYYTMNKRNPIEEEPLLELSALD